MAGGWLIGVLLEVAGRTQAPAPLLRHRPRGPGQVGMDRRRLGGPRRPRRLQPGRRRGAGAGDPPADRGQDEDPGPGPGRGPRTGLAPSKALADRMSGFDPAAAALEAAIARHKAGDLAAAEAGYRALIAASETCLALCNLGADPEGPWRRRTRPNRCWSARSAPTRPTPSPPSTSARTIGATGRCAEAVPFWSWPAARRSWVSAGAIWARPICRWARRRRAGRSMTSAPSGSTARPAACPSPNGAASPWPARACSSGWSRGSATRSWPRGSCAI